MPLTDANDHHHAAPNICLADQNSENRTSFAGREPLTAGRLAVPQVFAAAQGALKQYWSAHGSGDLPGGVNASSSVARLAAKFEAALFSLPSQGHSQRPDTQQPCQFDGSAAVLGGMSRQAVHPALSASPAAASSSEQLPKEWPEDDIQASETASGQNMGHEVEGTHRRVQEITLQHMHGLIKDLSELLAAWRANHVPAGGLTAAQEACDTQGVREVGPSH